MCPVSILHPFVTLYSIQVEYTQTPVKPIANYYYPVCSLILKYLIFVYTVIWSGTKCAYIFFNFLL